jgi:hypothetical protein
MTQGSMDRTSHTEVSNMRLTKSLGSILLAIWLILWGLMAIVTGFTLPPIVMAVLAIAAGILILLGR